MDAMFDTLLWLSLNYKQSSQSNIQLDEIFNKSKSFFSKRNGLVPPKDTISKLMMVLFKTNKYFVYQNSQRHIAFRNVEVTSQSDNITEINIPSYCAISYSSLKEFTIDCPLTTCINGKQIRCKIIFGDSQLIINVLDVVLKSSFGVSISQKNIDCILALPEHLKFCEGPLERYEPQNSYTEELWSSVQDENSVKRRFRTNKCQSVLSIMTVSNCCAPCRDSYRKAKKRHLNNEEKKIIPLQSSTAQTSADKNLLINLNEKDANDVQMVIQELLSKQQVPAHLELLLKDQLNNSKEFDPRQRRWNPKIISIALGLYIKSPSAFEQLKNANVLVLPSKRLMQYYKNSVKQPVGFSADNIQWMERESQRQCISKFGRRGGLVIDKMTIQDDLVIERKGNTWNLVGMVDMGETNNNISVICHGEKKVELATHALQFVFHGFTGFRWPVAYFGSNPATAHQLYTTFWKCVDVLGEKGFTIDYVMLDGASTNRTFSHMLFNGDPVDSSWLFSDVFDRQHQISSIQDIMHCMKKIRNNIESSREDHDNAKGRYLKLNERTVVWDHWEACGRYNFQSGFKIHRFLTKEHIEITPASKMRNKLATDVLSKDMLYLMKSYQQTLENPEILASSIAVLEQTSILIDIFCDKNRPITQLSDVRLTKIYNASKFFDSWKLQVTESDKLTTRKHFLTRETSEDLNSSLVGFLSLCQQLLKSCYSINPGYFNSDIVENLFCQQRGIRNGLNTNPTLCQYGPANTAIILGQSTISGRSNSGNSATYFTGTTNRALNPYENRSKKINVA